MNICENCRGSSVILMEGNQKFCPNCCNDRIDKEPDKVFIIESRSYEKGMIVSVNAAVVTSVEKSIEFMKENTDYDTGFNWWWAFYPMAVDSKCDFDDLYLYNSKVERIYWQPTSDKAPIQLGNTYQFDLSGGEFSYLGNYMLEGKLVDTEDEKLTFENVHLYNKRELVREVGTNVFDLEELHGIYPPTPRKLNKIQ